MSTKKLASAFFALATSTALLQAAYAAGTPQVNNNKPAADKACSFLKDGDKGFFSTGLSKTCLKIGGYVDGYLFAFQKLPNMDKSYEHTVAFKGDARLQLTSATDTKFGVFKSYIDASASFTEEKASTLNLAHVYFNLNGLKFGYTTNLVDNFVGVEDIAQNPDYLLNDYAQRTFQASYQHKFDSGLTLMAGVETSKNGLSLKDDKALDNLSLDEYVTAYAKENIKKAEGEGQAEFDTREAAEKNAFKARLKDHIADHKKEILDVKKQNFGIVIGASYENDKLGTVSAIGAYNTTEDLFAARFRYEKTFAKKYTIFGVLVAKTKDNLNSDHEVTIYKGSGIEAKTNLNFKNTAIYNEFDGKAAIFGGATVAATDKVKVGVQVGSNFTSDFSVNLTSSIALADSFSIKPELSYLRKNSTNGFNLTVKAVKYF